MDKELKTNRREKLLYEICTSEKQHFIKSIENNSKNENIYLNNNYKIPKGAQGKNGFRISKNKESFLKVIYNKNNNYKHKKKDEILNKIQITKEHIFLKLKEDYTYKEDGILYFTNNKQILKNEIKINRDKESNLNDHFTIINSFLIQKSKKLSIPNNIKFQQKRFKYYISSILLNFLMIVLLFFSSNAKLIEFNDFSHSSRISIKLKGKGVKYFINKDYGSSPSSIYINNELQYSSEKFYNFTESVNTVTFYIYSNSLEGMFKNLESITEVNILSYDSSAYNIKRMFEGCKNLVTANLRSIYTSSYLQCDYLFKGCEKLSALTLNNYQISVSSMEGMFYNCKALFYDFIRI